mmetsp:Transcript_62650/g.130220  ORF Transcript_62650/g.130220 Transcript_62650/m.130220 type:complete len:238 (+) Transcript_62650:844-1557(+)
MATSLPSWSQTVPPTSQWARQCWWWWTTRQTSRPSKTTLPLPPPPPLLLQLLLLLLPPPPPPLLLLLLLLKPLPLLLLPLLPRPLLPLPLQALLLCELGALLILLLLLLRRGQLCFHLVCLGFPLVFCLKASVEQSGFATNAWIALVPWIISVAAGTPCTAIMAARIAQHAHLITFSGVFGFEFEWELAIFTLILRHRDDVLRKERESGARALGDGGSLFLCLCPNSLSKARMRVSG